MEVSFIIQRESLEIIQRVVVIRAISLVKFQEILKLLNLDVVFKYWQDKLL